MSAEQKSPEQIREEIAETRADLGDTVEALSGKADVKGQAKAKVDEAKLKVDSAKGEAKAKVDSAAHSVQENPVPVAVVAAFGAGVIVGWILAR
jgi:ElaB/YqjD/DUF883 family membrane-anchored ribosome-binding protein